MKKIDNTGVSLASLKHLFILVIMLQTPCTGCIFKLVPLMVECST